MKIKRTANAGVLLELDGVRILLDGVCGELAPYLATPESLRRELLLDPPDVVAFTHAHIDHYDAAFVSEYLQKAAGPVLGPADIPFTTQGERRVGEVQINQVSTRHIGKQESLEHYSYILKGSRCIWFVGDASPLEWKNHADLPRPDVLIAPYGYAICGGWQICAQLGAKVVILVHLPNRDNDPCDLWKAVEATAGKEKGPALYILPMGGSIQL